MDKPKGKLRILPDVSFRFVAPYSLDECSKRLMALDNRSKDDILSELTEDHVRVDFDSKCSGSSPFKVLDHFLRGYDPMLIGLIGLC